MFSKIAKKVAKYLGYIWEKIAPIWSQGLNMKQSVTQQMESEYVSLNSKML